MIGLSATLVALVFAASTAHAHGGGLDKQGCHHNRKAGGYHCHRGAMAGQNFGSKAEALRSTQGKRKPAVSRRVPATGAAITGRASVIDGDTIDIHGQRIRLHGIDAPESRQTCEVMGKTWRCGQKPPWRFPARSVAAR